MNTFRISWGRSSEYCAPKGDWYLLVQWRGRYLALCGPKCGTGLSIKWNCKGLRYEGIRGFTTNCMDFNPSITRKRIRWGHYLGAWRQF